MRLIKDATSIKERLEKRKVEFWLLCSVHNYFGTGFGQAKEDLLHRKRQISQRQQPELKIARLVLYSTRALTTVDFRFLQYALAQVGGGETDAVGDGDDEGDA